MENRLTGKTHSEVSQFYQAPKKDFLLVRITLLIFITTFFTGCIDNKKVKISKPYTGPLIEVYNVTAILTDSAQPKVLMKAPRQLELENGDRLFPEGVNIEFFGQKNDKSSVLTAKHGKYNKEKNLYTVKNNVEIINRQENKKLNTELLHWNPVTRKIYTDKFVKIETPSELLTGTGLESNEDFSNYKILKVSGVFPLNE